MWTSSGRAARRRALAAALTRTGSADAVGADEVERDLAHRRPASAAAARSASRGRSRARAAAGPGSARRPSSSSRVRSRSRRRNVWLTLHDRAVGQRREVAARARARRDPRRSPRRQRQSAVSASPRSRSSPRRGTPGSRRSSPSGALRFGQWPVAFEQRRAARPADLRVRRTRRPPRRDHVLAALQDERGTSTRGEVGAVVGEERDARELLRDRRVGAAEAVRQLLAELGPVGVAHDHRRHRARPAEVVAVERVEQPVDVLAREAADVVAVVDVARRRARPARARRSAPAPRCAASTPIIALTEWPTKTTSSQVELAADLERRRRRSRRASRTCRGRRRRGRSRPAPTWSKSTTR